MQHATLRQLQPQVMFHDSSRYATARVPLLTDLYGFTRASLSSKGVLYSSPPQGSGDARVPSMVMYRCVCTCTCACVSLHAYRMRARSCVRVPASAHSFGQEAGGRAWARPARTIERGLGGCLGVGAP